MSVARTSVAVELSVTVWERTWAATLVPEFFDRITASVGRRFERVTVTVNNVSDPEAVRRRIGELVAARVVDGHIEVADALPRALRMTGLTERKLGPLPHYTDHFLAKICASGPEFLVHWDTDVRLTRPGDWVTPSLRFLSEHPDVLFAMPGWSDDWSMRAERLAATGDFDLGYGFSDHVFLVNRRRFAAPIYGAFAPASWWYPTSHLAPIFEQRVDAWMRRRGLLRATYREVRYSHDEAMATQPAGTLIQRTRRRAQRTGYDLAQRLPGFNPVLHRRPPAPDLGVGRRHAVDAGSGVSG